MHSTIIQIEPTEGCYLKQEPATESDFENETDKVDYYELLTGEEREARINYVIKQSEWYKRLFVPLQGTKDKLVYNGKVEELKAEWIANIQAELTELKNDKGFDTFKITEAINRPTNTCSLFYIKDWDGLMYPTGFFDFLSRKAERGDIFIIRSIFDYHW